jgi:hypothetical protein
MTLTRIATAASLSLALAAPGLAAAKNASHANTTRITTARANSCESVFAEGDSTWMKENRAELGELTGLLNGVFYLTGDAPSTDRGAPANLVIKNKQGQLDLWVAGDSRPLADGSFARTLVAQKFQGSGIYAGAKVDLTLQGTYYPEQGGKYQLFGTICFNTDRPRR